MARQVLPVVGAVIGSFFGPGGAQWGWAIGSLVGNAVDPQIIKGPSIGDIAQQTSQEGVPIPIVFGLSQPIAGNIIVSAPHRTVPVRRSQGKGGPKVQTEAVYRTYAIGACEGEHTFVRVWKNNQLVYDITDNSLLTEAENSKFLEVARFFTGRFDQNPSPDLEAIFGIGTTPAHRGKCYMVMADDDLTDMRGAIPQFMFQMGDAAAPAFSDTLLELHFEGANGSTDIIDSSSHAHVVTASGSGQISTADKVCGESSLQMGATGELQITDAAQFNPGNSDFTVEWWFKVDHPDIPSGTFFRKQAFTTLYPYNVTFTENGGLRAIGAAGEGTAWAPGTTAYDISIDILDGMLPGQWYHIALERFGGVFTLFLNGIGFPDAGNPAAGPPIVPGAFTGNLASNDEPLRICNPTSGIGDGVVRMDDFVWTPSAKYHGNNFTPPACSSQSSLTLAEIVTEISRRANLPADKIDVTELDDEVLGLTVINTYPAYAALQSLSAVFHFDPSDQDAVVKFVKRGANSVATITDDELVDDGDVEKRKRPDSIQIPRVLHLNYFDVAGGLATDKQTSERSGDRRAEGETSLQSAVIMDADKAAQVVTINHKVMIENANGEMDFCLPDSFIRLTTADVIIIEWDGVNRRARLEQVQVRDGYQEYKAVQDRQSAYTSNVEGIPAAPQTPPPSSIVGPTVLHILDIQILTDADDNAGLIYYAAVSGVLPAWQGAQVELSIDGGENYISSATTTISAVVGTLVTELGDHPQAYPDVFNSVQVQIDTPFGELEETDLTGLLNGQNLVIIGNELIQFADVDEVSENVWEISYFLRGRKGTEPVTHPVGTRFVLLDRGSLSMIPASLADIGRTLTFRATSFGTAEEDGVVTSIVYTGRSQIEREPAYLEARREGDDAIVTWQGVGRLGGGASVAHGLRFAGYRVTFDDGATEVSVDTQDEELVHDVSALLSPLTISVVQLNDLTGAGPAAEVILE